MPDHAAQEGRAASPARVNFDVCWRGPLAPPDSPEQAQSHVVNGGSLLVTGLAGTGKSTFCKGLVAGLKSPEAEGGDRFQDPRRFQSNWGGHRRLLGPEACASRGLQLRRACGSTRWGRLTSGFCAS